MNSVVLIGRLTRDPEVRYTANTQMAVATFTIAIDRPVRAGGEKQTDFPRITVFGKQGLRPVDEETSELHFRMLRETLTRAGFEHYEVSNFARPGFRARHNSAYWRGEPYLGAGPSAHSYDGERQRSWNVSSNRLYLSGAPRETELLTTTDLLNEYLMTRLRTADGIDLGTIRERFGPDEARRIAARCERFAASGEMQPTDRGFAIPPAHFLVSDYVISELFA